MHTPIERAGLTFSFAKHQIILKRARGEFFGAVYNSKITYVKRAVERIAAVPRPHTRWVVLPPTIGVAKSISRLFFFFFQLRRSNRLPVLTPRRFSVFRLDCPVPLSSVLGCSVQENNGEAPFIVPMGFIIVPFDFLFFIPDEFCAP